MLSPELAEKGREYSFYGAAAELQQRLGEELIIAGPADTGKTLSACYILNKLCWKYPGAQIAIVRKFASSIAGTVWQTFKDRILLPTDGVIPYGGELSPNRLLYPTGSTIWLGGLDKASKVLSSERDIIYVNQAEELILKEWEILRTRASMRAGHMPFAWLFGDCNPEHPQHWIKTMSDQGVFTMLQSSHRDNPEIYDPETGELTSQGKQRLAVLKKATGATRQRLFLGLWAAPEGAIYEVFEEARHKVEAFTPPPLWPRAVGIDPLGAYIGGVFVAYDVANQRLNVYREYLEPFGITTRKHCENLLELAGYDAGGYKQRLDAENIAAWVGGGPSERQARLDWEDNGIPLLESGVFEVWSGIDRIIELLDTGRLVIHDCCPNLLSEIGSYRRTLKNGIPTDNIENKDTYHLLDALRYIVAWLTKPIEQNTVSEMNYSIGFY